MRKLSKMEKARRWAKKNTLSLVALFGVLLVGGLGVHAFTGGNSAINVSDGGVVNVDTIVVESGGEGGIGAAVFTTPGTNLTDLNVDNDLSVDGDAEIDGTLQVDGATTLTGALTMTGAITNPEFSSTVLATSTDSETTGVLTQSDLSTYDMFSVSIGSASGMTYTLPASSTMTSELATAGDRKSWIIDNTTTTAGVNLTLGAGTGSFLLFTSSTASTPTCFASSTCILTGVKKSNTDINWLFDTYAN